MSVWTCTGERPRRVHERRIVLEDFVYLTYVSGHNGHVAEQLDPRADAIVHVHGQVEEIGGVRADDIVVDPGAQRVSPTALVFRGQPQAVRRQPRIGGGGRHGGRGGSALRNVGDGRTRASSRG